MKLTFDLYRDSEFRGPTGPFGLRLGQMRGQDLVHNGGWYNCRGEFLGWGDLSLTDLLRIAEEIDENEVFFVLQESDWRDWRLPTDQYLNLGTEYVFHKVAYVITRGRVHRVVEKPAHLTTPYFEQGFERSFEEVCFDHFVTPILRYPAAA